MQSLICNPANTIDINLFKTQNVICERKYCEILKILDKKASVYYASERWKKGSSSYNSNCFSRESNTISKLNHPSILKFIGITDVDFYLKPLPMVITEYASNGSLEDILKEKYSILTDTKKLIIIYGIAHSLLYLHSHDILHCDIQLKNIFLDSQLKNFDF